jgi:lipopolysaccharide export system permease protein
LGFSLGVKENRGKGRNAAVWGLLCLIAYYASFFGLVGMAKGGKIPVMLALLGPNLLLFSMGIYFYRKLDWQS